VTTTKRAELNRIPLDSLNLRAIKERPEVQLRCKRDITFLVNEDDNEEVRT
jgi:hypothetical protein